MQFGQILDRCCFPDGPFLGVQDSLVLPQIVGPATDDLFDLWQGLTSMTVLLNLPSRPGTAAVAEGVCLRCYQQLLFVFHVVDGIFGGVDLYKALLPLLISLVICLQQYAS